MAKRKRRNAARRRSRKGRVSGDAQRVVGFFASDGENVLCHEDACIITGALPEMHNLLKESAKRRRHAMTVRKTTFAEIRQGLQWGAAYGLDQQAYEVFQPLALRVGLPLVEKQLLAPDAGALHVVRLGSGEHPLRSRTPEPEVWFDDDGLHTVVLGQAPPEARQDEMTRRYQQKIRTSPLWQQIVDEFGVEEAERLLKDCRVEFR
jgi:hypothetical protein